MSLTPTQYAALVLSGLDLLKTTIIAPNSTGSIIETRYISSEGDSDEQWVGFLRDEDRVVDRWLLTVTSVDGLSQQDPLRGSVGTFNKPVTVVCDYYADYHHGPDAVGVVGSETVTNTEREFIKKVLAVDFALENKRGCLGGNIFIDRWNFQTRLRRFETATTHWANGFITLRFGDIIL